MSWITESWVFLRRIRRRIGKPSREASQAERHLWIDKHAPGRSFADVGGLFQLHGEMAYRAETAGAAEVTLFDSGDEDYLGLAAERRKSRIRFVQGDLEEPESVLRIGPHDIVWCTGVVYHTPNPVLQLMHLREITRELLFLGSRTIPEIPGFDQACIYYPNLAESSRRAHSRAYWKPESLWGIGVPFDDRPMYGHGNMWWGITPSALRAMLWTARFEIVEERHPHDYPWAVDVVARPVDKEPLLPPRSYFRARGDRDARGEELLPFEDYYDYARQQGDHTWLRPAE